MWGHLPPTPWLVPEPRAAGYPGEELRCVGLRDRCLEMLGGLYSDLAKDLGKEGGAWGPLTSSVTRARYLVVWWHLRKRRPACTWQARYACPADSHA